MSDFFGRTSRDMLEKARHKFAAMRLDLNPDTIGDFFTTAFHVMDYVRSDLGIPPTAPRQALPLAIQHMYDDPDMTTVRELNNLHKHARLDPNRRSSSSPRIDSHSDTAFIEPTKRYAAKADNANIDLEAVGARIIEKLESLLNAHGL